MDPQSARFLDVVPLGVMSYTDALELQRSVARSRIGGVLEQDLLLLVEHPHVVTLGRSFKPGHLVASPALLASRGVELFDVERGGDATYHGPGQLVGYPIIGLRRHKQDLHWYLRQVERALIHALADVGVSATRNSGFTGVWVGATPSGAERDADDTPRRNEVDGGGARKIASIGVHARDWVTWHGFALNVTTDLSFFDMIVPCGIAGVEMTSVARELARPGRASTVAPSADGTNALGPTMTAAVIASFGDAFALEPRPLSLVELRARLDPSALLTPA